MSKVIGVGTDLCQISRIARAMEKEHFYMRVFTETERAYLDRKEKTKTQSAAAMFAAKEAAAKALGTGFLRGIQPWTIEVTHDENGVPGIRFLGEAQEKMAQLGASAVHLSLSHEGDMALAFCVMEG